MVNMRVLQRLLAYLPLISLILGACVPSTQATQKTSGETVTLKMAVLPILDALPMYVAQQEGYFTARNVRVELIPAASAAERDQIIQSGQADGMINEIVSTLFYNRDQVQTQIVRFARIPSSASAVFRILASKQSGITTVDGLRGVEIGISEGTMIEYLTDRLLQAEGLKPDEIKTIAVPKIPDRMALISKGELKAAMLPDPLSSLAMQEGAVLVLDDTSHSEYSHSTYSFRKAVIDSHPEAVRAFLAAIEDAVRTINTDPGRWSSLLSEQNLVPAPLLSAYQVPEFVTAGVPSESQWNDVMDWAKSKGLILKDVSYRDSVNSSLLP